MLDKLQVMLIEARVRVKVIEELLGMDSTNWDQAPANRSGAMNVPGAAEPDILSQLKGGSLLSQIKPMEPKVAASIEPPDTVRVLGAGGLVTHEPIGEVMA